MAWMSGANVDRLELVRGPMSVQYGSDALGGAINVIGSRPAFSSGGTRVSGSLDLTGARKDAASVLKDPNNILSKRSIYYELDKFDVKDEYRGLVEAHATEFAAQPGPDPAMFGVPADDDGGRTDALLFQNLITNAFKFHRGGQPVVRISAQPTVPGNVYVRDSRGHIWLVSADGARYRVPIYPASDQEIASRCRARVMPT